MTANCLFQTLEITEDGLAVDFTDAHFGFIVEPDFARAVLALIALTCLLLQTDAGSLTMRSFLYSK